ncbi:hypothetical protein F4779DRAFT_620754 [Xylariaceae sp. FL0662B]|nr:hypothetical protein F4779DRAFT_620754 [Xylariaceae sp. FL0662B]
MPSSQRPFFLSSFLAAFRQQTPPGLSGPSSASATATATASTQPNKHTHPSQPTTGTTPSGARSISSTSHSHTHSQSHSRSHSQSQSPPPQRATTGGVMNQLPLASPRGGVPIPGPGSGGRRRGSDSSSEGFRDVLGAEKWYIGGRTAGGEEKFFKLGVVKRARSQDRLSLDRLSL